MKVYGYAFAIAGFLAVAIGAFGAHALKDRLDAHHMEIFRTGSAYHFYHALALGLTVILAASQDSRALGFAAFFFSLGTILFSGSLYALAVTGISVLGAITPLGGLSFLAGWGCLAWHFSGR